VASGREAKTKAAGIQRLAVLALSALLVVLFVGFAVAQGIGNPSVPSGDVAIVKGVPEEDGRINREELDRAIEQQATQGGLKKAPKPGSAKYDELTKAALGELFDAIWIKGEGEELGITVTDKEIEAELEQIKEQNFQTEKAYKEFLKTSHFTREDVDKRVELQVLSTQIQEQVNKEAPSPTSSEIAAYYDEAKATQYTTKPSRNVRVVINSDKKKAEKAAAILAKDNSEASWKKVAEKYSSDPTSKAKGGLLESISEETLEEPLKSAVFGAQKGELVGPIKYQSNYMVLEVAKVNSEEVQPLDEVEAQIKSQLEQQMQQEFFSEFIGAYQSKWASRTFCADGYVIERCANYKGSGHASSAPPACYEADPKTPATECPAPVQQSKPALPGSVSILKPQGEPLAQRPVVPGSESAASTPAEGTPVPAEAAPPTGE
jgi:parvulin-like peptidyl-prolyl isomerase